MTRIKTSPAKVAGTTFDLKAVIFQDNETVSKDKSGKEITYIHTGTLSTDSVKKGMNVFLGSLLAEYFQPTMYTVNKNTPNAYTLENLPKVSQLKGLKIAFQFNGKQVFLTGKARLTGCIGKGINSLNFQKLAFQLLGLISEVTESEELLTAIAVMFKAAGKTDEQIKALTNDAKIEISKTGTKIANIAIREVRKSVKENSQYGVYLTGLQETKKLLKAAEAKETLQVSK